MEIVTLSHYLYKNNSASSYIDLNTDIDYTKFEVGNLVIKEHFEKGESSFSYIKETMIIIDIKKNGVLTLTLKPVIFLDKNKIYVNDYEETFYFENNSWKGEDGKSCDNLSLISPNKVVGRTNISEGYIFEDDGNEVSPPRIVNMDDYRPSWCKN